MPKCPSGFFKTLGSPCFLKHKTVENSLLSYDVMELILLICNSRKSLTEFFNSCLFLYPQTQHGVWLSVDTQLCPLNERRKESELKGTY